jgi:uncharacterized protein related to proFAR isomerase
MAEKLSSQKVAEVLVDAAQALRKTAKERDEYKKLAEGLQRRDQAEKLAAQMHEKGLETDTDVADLADRLEKAAQAGKIDTIAAAVDLVGPDMGEKIAKLTTDETRVSAGSSNLERFIFGDVG